jgi:tRNA1(Val) A37 N6-methylase TrmN6
VLGLASDQNAQQVQSGLGDETQAIEWLDGLPLDATLVDIGAGAGLHAVYAAVARKATVYAMEADAQCRAALAANAASNQVADRVTVFPLALTDGTSWLRRARFRSRHF